MGTENRGKMSDHDQLATDREVQNFKAALRVLLSDERLLQGGKEWETMVIDKCSVALNTLVELHYDNVTCWMLLEDRQKNLNGPEIKFVIPEPLLLIWNL